MSTSWGRGLATLTGTAGTVAGNVGHLANRAIGGLAKEVEAVESTEDRSGMRAAVGGWLRKKRPLIGPHRIVLFPGWAVQVPLEGRAEPQPFDILIHISGFCTMPRTPEQATRTQRMFTRMAKNFADLPNVPSASLMAPARPSDVIVDSSGELSDAPITASPVPLEDDPFFAPTENPLKLDTSHIPTSILTPPTPSSPVHPPPFPTRRSSTLPNHKVPSTSTTLPPRLDSTSTSSPSPSSVSSSSAMDHLTSASLNSTLLDMQANLSIRLQPFFASVIPNRDIILEIRPKLTRLPEDGSDESPKRHVIVKPLVQLTLSTSLNGTFMENIRIPWDALVEDPNCLDLIFPERVSARRRKNLQSPSDQAGSAPHEWGLEVTARMVMGEGEEPVEAAPSSFPPPPVHPSSTIVRPPTTNTREASPAKDEGASSTKDTIFCSTLTPLSSPQGVRIISDLDDTVKHSDIMGGLRNVFRNVFCRDSKDLEVAGMGELYRTLHSEGGVKGCHFVSNSPYELFEPINSFLHVAEFPRGFSLKLKFYGGRSVFKGLWEPAGERKARGVYEILDGFPQSKFLMFGDSAEQDLDLYASIAAERPHQVLGIFIRDVSILVPTPSSKAPPISRSSSTLTSSSSSISNQDLLCASASHSRSPDASRSRSGTVDSVSSSSSSVRGKMSRLTSYVTPIAQPSTTTPPAVTPTGFKYAVREKVRGRLSRTNSLVNDPPSGTAEAPQPSVAGVYSEDTLDPLYASRPASPQFHPSLLGEGEALTDEPEQQPQQVDIEEAMTSARLKQLKQAEGFRTRFENAKRSLEPRGVPVHKFRDVEEVTGLLLDLARQERGE